MKKKSIIYIVVISIVIVGALTGLCFLSQKKSSDIEPTTPPSDSNVTDGRVERTIQVSGATWRYSIDQELETKYSIKVKTNNDSTVIYIEGKACNSMSAEVTQRNEGASDDNDVTRQIDGKKYVLKAPMRTLMACTGDLADADTKLDAEIRNIFMSMKV